MTARQKTVRAEFGKRLSDILERDLSIAAQIRVRPEDFLVPYIDPARVVEICRRSTSRRPLSGRVLMKGEVEVRCLSRSPLPQRPDAALSNPRAARRALLLTFQRHRPELVDVTTRVALGVEADLRRWEHAPLDGVDLADQLALARQCHVAALDEDLEVRRPALL